MAGEIEEPFSLSFQADSLHSGSISFGRFEAESLSWERRSSFSHNRYLEEVEKYSKPGSVTEKKAYFEAHFRRKALMSQSSPKCQSGTDYQTSENDTSENKGYSEEFEHNNEGIHSVQFDKSSANSEYDGYSEEECEKEMRTSYVEPLFEPAFNVASVVQSVPDHVNLEKEHQMETESVPVIDAEPGKEVRENLNDEATDVDMTYKAIHLPTSSHTSTEDIASLDQQESSLKVGSKLGSKLIRNKSKSPVSVSRVRRNVSFEPSKDAAKKPIRTERECPATKTERQSSQTTAPTAHSAHGTSKTKDSKSSKLKVIHDNRSSEKELKGKKVVEPKPSVPEKVVPKALQAARPKLVDNSTKPGIKQSSSVFSFKSDQRAERRKEFFMKLEEKIHAKEAEMNQIQAKKMEKTEAEIKQLRRSLNFRATPMPSFYHEGMQQDSDRNKAVSSNTKPIKLRSKSTPGFGAARRSPSHAKAGIDQAPFNAEGVNATDPPQDSAATNCSLTSVSMETVATTHIPSTSRGHPPQDETNREATGMKEQGKENGASLKNHRVSASSKVTKGNRSEGNRKVGAARSKNEMVRKGMKGVGIGSASRMGPLAVGVAS